MSKIFERKILTFIFIFILKSSLVFAGTPGTSKWVFETSDERPRNYLCSSPAIGLDGTIYIASQHYTYAINPDGKLKWKTEGGRGRYGTFANYSSPAIDTDGTIYVGSEDYIYAKNAVDGTLKWKFPAKGCYTPAIDIDGSIYVGARDGFYAINPDGTLKWKFEAKGRFYPVKFDSFPTIGIDGTLYVGGSDGLLYAVSSDGTLKWKFKAIDNPAGSGIGNSAIGVDGTIYLASWASSGLYAINPDGTLKWEYREFLSPSSASPAIGVDGTIYVGSWDGLYAISSDGELKWKFEPELGIAKGGWYYSPAIDVDGTVYISMNFWHGAIFGIQKSRLYAIHSDSYGLAKSPWPMLHHDVRHTGRFEDEIDLERIYISPSQGGNTGQVTVGIFGQGFFTEGTTVKLVKNGQKIIGRNNEIMNSYRMTTTFDLVGRLIGSWSLFVELPNGRQFACEDCFTIEESEGPELIVRTIGRDQIRTGRWMPLIASCTNVGNVDATDLVFILSLDGDVEWEMPLERKLPPEFNPADFPVDVHTAEGRIAIPLWIEHIGPGQTITQEIKIRVQPRQMMRQQALPGPSDVVKIYIHLRRGYHYTAAAYAANRVKSDLEWYKTLQNPELRNLRFRDWPSAYQQEFTEIYFMPAYEAEYKKIIPKPPTTQEKTLEFVLDQLLELTPELKTILETIENIEAAADLTYHFFAKNFALLRIPDKYKGDFRDMAEFVICDMAELVTKEIEKVRSWDPNDKTWPSGFDLEGTPVDQQKHFIALDNSLPYVIYFENLENATAAAQEVFITDQLDSNLDWSTFFLSDIQIGEKIIPVPEQVKNFKTVIDLGSTSSTVIEMDCKFEGSKGLATWTFRGKNPDTDELADFLPPNKEEVIPRGEGFISYSVKPKPDLSTRTVIRNKAAIIFDVNPPINTPEVFNTIDSGAPASHIKPLPKETFSPIFTVEWEGEDDKGGSGIRDYTIYVSEDGKTFTEWISNTTKTSDTFTGKTGETYHFYSRAKDNVGNIEKIPSKADTTTTISNTTVARVVINEIYPNVVPDEDGEWIELYNVNDFPVDIHGCRIEDGDGELDYTIPESASDWNGMLEAGSYLVVHLNGTFDSPAKDLHINLSSAALNDDGDSVILFNQSGTALDFIRYGVCETVTPEGTSWTGANPEAPAQGQSLGRDRKGSDTDDGSDWENTGGFDVDSPTIGKINTAYIGALSLDGKGDYVEVPDNPSLDIESQITLESWVFLNKRVSDSDSNDGYGYIVCKGIFFSNLWWNLYNLMIVQDQITQNVHAMFEISDGVKSKYNVISTSTIPIQEWTHIAGIYDGDNLQLFVDGNLESINNVSITIAQNDMPLGIGGCDKSVGKYFPGTIDEVRIWNIARTQEEIRETISKTLQGDEPGLVGYWDFDDGTANDSSSYSNHGKLMGDAQIIPIFGTWLDKKIEDDVGEDETIPVEEEIIPSYDTALISQYVSGSIDEFPADSVVSPPSDDLRSYTVSLPKQSAKEGEIINVPITIDDATGLLAGGITIKYDSAVLRAISYGSLELLSGYYWKANTDLKGEVRFAFATTEPTKGHGKLMMVEFEVLPHTEGKTSLLAFDNVSLSNSQSTTKIDGEVRVIPSTFDLLQNYPNPFNPETWIPFKLASDVPVTIHIYNIKGQLVRTLRLGKQNAGIYMTRNKAVYWDGMNNSGEEVGKGVYFYTLQAGNFSATRKMAIVK